MSLKKQKKKNKTFSIAFSAMQNNTEAAEVGPSAATLRLHRLRYYISDLPFSLPPKKNEAHAKCLKYMTKVKQQRQHD